LGISTSSIRLCPKSGGCAGWIQQANPDCELELDGGIDPATARLGVAAGANVLVAGSSIFGDPAGVDVTMRQLRRATQESGEY